MALFNQSGIDYDFDNEDEGHSFFFFFFLLNIFIQAYPLGWICRHECGFLELVYIIITMKDIVTIWS